MNELSNLEQQAKSVCDKAHHLLGSPMNQLEGVVDTEKLMIEIPKGLIYSSGYLSMLSQNIGQAVACWGHHEQALARKHKGHRAMMKEYIEHVIKNTLHEELHLLATLRHPFLKTTTLSGE